MWITHGTTKYKLNFSVHHYDGWNWDIYIAVCKHNFSIFIRM